LPSSRGGGVVLPRSRPGGGSRAFDANKPGIVHIDPDIAGQSCVVDLSKLDKHMVQRAYEEQLNNGLVNEDIRLLAAATFYSLA
jgi:hypothetical protein